MSEKMRKGKTERGIVIVTGASSGIGKAVAKELSAEGYQVYGIGRNFSEEEDICHSENFHSIILDMMQTQKLYDCVRELAAQHPVYALIQNAGVAYYGLHETLSPAKIHEMVTVNLEIPMTMTQLLLRDLKKTKGYVIQISSVTAKQASPHGCAYAATKAGLTSFGESLFTESRKYGVHVCTIHPDMVKTNLYRHADFQEGEEPDTYLIPEEVAEAVRAVLAAPDTMSVTDITVRPQKHQIRRKIQQP